jgi:hypothetical protein
MYRAFLLSSALLMASCLLHSAQAATLSLSSASSSPGESVDLTLNLTGGGRTPPASLEYTFSYSSLAISSVSVTLGASASAAGKSILCTNGQGSTSCMVWGDNTTGIADGVVANVRLALASAASDSSSPVVLSAGSAATAWGYSLGMSLSGSNVSVLAGLNGFSCDPILIEPPDTSTCTISLTAPAGSGGTTITFSAPEGGVSVPTSVTIPAGSSSASFTVSGLAVSSSTPSLLTASYQGQHQDFGVTVNPARIAMSGTSPNATEATR